MENIAGMARVKYDVFREADNAQFSPLSRIRIPLIEEERKKNLNK